jgi:hypothetical protein
MAGLADIRAQHPEYGDLSDQQLADGMYRKYYSDMPRAQFDQKMGLAMSPAERFNEAAPGAADPNAPRPGLQAATSAAADTEGQRQAARDWNVSVLGVPILSTKPGEIEKSLGTGIVRLPARMVGAYKDITETAGAAAGGIAGWLGASDETAKGIHDTVTGAAANVPVFGSLPSSEEVLDKAGQANEAVSTATGVDLGIHQPQGWKGAIGETAGGLLGGPGLAAPAVERAAATAAAPAAEAATAAPAAAKTAPTLAEMKGATDVAYTTARDAGITVYGGPFSRIANETIAAARKAGFNDIAKASKGYKQTKGVKKFLDTMSERGDDLTGEELDQIRQEFGDAYKAAKTEKDRRIITIMKDQFDKSVDTLKPGVDMTSSKMAPEEAAKLWKDARATKTAEETAKSVEKAFGGKTSVQIQKQAQKWLDDPRRMARLGPEEQDLVRQMATTSKPEALANLIGKVVPGGPLGGFLAGHFAGPAGVAASGAVTATKMVTAANRVRRGKVLSDIVRSAGPKPAGAAADALPADAIPEPAALPPPELPPATSPPVPWLAIGAGDRPQRQLPP